jgi:hypothetical protein
VSETTAIRTLVKSAPELWAACSDRESLARHLGAFGEIRITRLEPETTVAWEGERASGTVTIEPSNWGTKVTMTATLPQDIGNQPIAELEPVAEEEPVVELEPIAPETATDVRRPGILARLLGLFARERPETVVGADPEPAAVTNPELALGPEQPARAGIVAAGEADPEAALGAALDSLGQAHHRPFSQF